MENKTAATPLVLGGDLFPVDTMSATPAVQNEIKILMEPFHSSTITLKVFSRYLQDYVRKNVPNCDVFTTLDVLESLMCSSQSGSSINVIRSDGTVLDLTG